MKSQFKTHHSNNNYYNPNINNQSSVQKNENKVEKNLGEFVNEIIDDIGTNINEKKEAIGKTVVAVGNGINEFFKGLAFCLVALPIEIIKDVGFLLALGGVTAGFTAFIISGGIATPLVVGLLTAASIGLISYLGSMFILGYLAYAFGYLTTDGGLEPLLLTITPLMVPVMLLYGCISSLAEEPMK